MDVGDWLAILFWGFMLLALWHKLANKRINLDDNGLKILSKLRNIKIIRRRYNQGVGRTFSRAVAHEEIPVNAPPAEPTALACLEEHLYFQGCTARGWLRTHYVVPFSEDNLNKMREFLIRAETMDCV